MDREAERRQAQLEFVELGQDIIIGNVTVLPLPLEALQGTTADSSATHRYLCPQPAS